MKNQRDGPLGRIQPFIKDMVYGANDGIVTTFVVISSVVGAQLETHIILIVGFASLFADGTSMAASDYLSTRTEQAQAGRESSWREPFYSALATFIAFVAAGALPLIPYVAFSGAPGIFWWAAGATALALILVGSLRTRFSARSAWRGAVEMLLIGGVAVAVAFAIGRFVGQFTNGM